MGVLTAVLLLAGCGGGEEESVEARLPPATREVRLTLDGRAGAENVAVQMAESQGFFAEKGLRVVAAAPAQPSRRVTYVSNGTDELGLAPLPEVAMAMAGGAPVVAVGGLVTEPTTAMIWLAKSKIGGVAELKGKTIAVPGGDFQQALLGDLLGQAGLTLDDVDVERVDYELVPALLSGRADAIFGGSWNIEGVELEARGAKPVVSRVEDHGVPAYEGLVAVAQTDFAAENPEVIRAFVSALVQGAAAAVEDPAAAADAIEQSPYSNPETDRRTTEAQLEATLPLLSASGEMDVERASELVGWMQERGMIPKRLPARSYSCRLLTCSSSSIP